MALDDMFQGGIDAAVRNRAQLAPIAPSPEPGFSFWGIPKAPFTGAAAGGVEAASFWSELVGAMGDAEAVMGSTGVLPVGVARDIEYRPEDVEESRERLRTGEAFSNPIADSLRDTARSFMPDEQTAGVAEQTVFQLSRVLTKAVGYSVVGGVPLGAAATGLDEGFTASDELRREGVDFTTRAQVGALTGVATAAGVALPVAGTGIRSTTALVAAGGPGLFVTQNYLTREILANANYDTLADRYDPFDPVGLAVSTLLPAAFGGWALRGRARAARAAEARAADSAPPPEGVPPEAVIAARDQPHNSELVDAARVQRAREIVDGFKLGDAGDIRAANDAVASAMRAAGQLSDGLPVNVTDAIPMEQANAAIAVERMISRAEATRVDLVADAERLADRGAVSAMRAEIQALRQAGDAAQTEEAIRVRMRDIQAARPRTAARTALDRARDEAAQRAAETDATIARLEQQIEDNANAVQARQALAVLDRQLEDMRAARAAIDAPATEITPVAAAVRQLAQETAARRAGNGAPADALPPEGAPLAGPEPRTGAIPDEPVAAPARIPEAAIEQAGDIAVDARLLELQASRPDALVRLEGSNEDIPLGEALARLEQAAQQEINDAGLLQVAANCALTAR